MSGVLMLDALRVTLRGQTLVDLTTSVTPGDILTIMGPSGTGKSTLLAAIIGTSAATAQPFPAGPRDQRATVAGWRVEQDMLVLESKY